MAKQLVCDELWAIIEPLLPARRRRKRNPGRLATPDRVCLEGIVFVLLTGIQWEHFPQQLGCCGMTLWRRLRGWQAVGVWDRVHRELLRRLNAADQLDWSRAVIDSGSVRAVGGAN